MRTMAERRDLFKRTPQLQRFLIANAHPTGRQLGVGSYGSVQELEVGGVVCAGKKIHEALVEQGNFGAESIASKYVEECQLMSDLRHPHLVQFLGVCFLPTSTLPVLVMERLLTSLDDLLEHNPDIPLSLKRSILADVARGLVYLHSRSPPVIHRDLSAKNVLLNSAMVAKITDLGNARIVNFQPGQLARTMSRIPGTMVYMPPEAFEDTSMYGPSLDSFSFGHLSLFTITQVFPGILLQYTYCDPENPRRRLARTEVQRRGKYIQLLHQQLGEQHPLTLLVKQCLDDEPSERPSAQELLQRLEGMRAQVEDHYQHLTKLEAMRMLREKDTEIRDLHTQVEASSTGRQEIVALQIQMEELQVETISQLSANEAEISRLVEELRRSQLEHSSQLTAKDDQLIARDAENFGLREDLRYLQADLEAREAQMGAETEQKETEIHRLMVELRDLKSQLQTPPVTAVRNSSQPTQTNFQLRPARALALGPSNSTPSLRFGGQTQSVLSPPKLSFGSSPSPTSIFRPSGGTGGGGGMGNGMGGGSQLGTPKSGSQSIICSPAISALRKRKNHASQNSGLDWGPGGAPAANSGLDWGPGGAPAANSGLGLGPEGAPAANSGLGLGPGGAPAANSGLGLGPGGAPATGSGLGLGPGGAPATGSGLGLGPGGAPVTSSSTGFNFMFSGSSGTKFNFSAGASGGSTLFTAVSSSTDSSNTSVRVIRKARRRKP